MFSSVELSYISSVQGGNAGGCGMQGGSCGGGMAAAPEAVPSRPVEAEEEILPTIGPAE